MFFVVAKRAVSVASLCAVAPSSAAFSDAFESSLHAGRCAHAIASNAISLMRLHVHICPHAKSFQRQAAEKVATGHKEATPTNSQRPMYLVTVMRATSFYSSSWACFSSPRNGMCIPFHCIQCDFMCASSRRQRAWDSREQQAGPCFSLFTSSVAPKQMLRRKRDGENLVQKRQWIAIGQVSGSVLVFLPPWCFCGNAPN